MKKYTVIIRPAILVFSAIMLFLRCGQLEPLAPVPGTHAAISASIHVPNKKLASDLTKIMLYVTSSKADTIVKELTLAAGSASGQVEVPVDQELAFTAFAYKDQLKVLHGQTKFTAEKGAANAVKIPLDFAMPAIILTPDNATCQKDDTLTVYLEARKVIDLAAIGARVVFDKNLLRVVDMGREDSLLTSNSGSITQLEFAKDNTLGTVDIVLGVFPASAAVSDSALANKKIARIDFQALDTGTADISLSLDNSVDSDLGLYDKKAELMQSFSMGSFITIQ